MKIILIPHCSKCPHGTQWNLDATEYMCGLKTKINYDKVKIPEYCPLDDAEKFAIVRQEKEIIDVWKIQAIGLGAYYDCDVNTIIDMLKDCDYEEGYIITKHQMDREEYEALPEFDGF